jgi:peptide/nickel transport system substrate-binding protein
MRLRTGYLAIMITAAAVGAAACSSGGTTTTAPGETGAATATGTPQHGGTLSYLVSGLLSQWDRGLDPASGGAAPGTYEDAIFGQLFRLTPSGGIEPVLAAGYSLSGGGTVVTIRLRPGVKFSDGTPFNAAAVAWNIRRDLATPCVCSPVTSWPPLASGPGGITTPDPLTVALHFTAPYAAVIQAIMGSSVNHIASPAAVARLGEKKFQLAPVGAGPFEVASNLVDTTLTLKRNPGYFQRGLPYLDGLVFKVVSTDETAYEAIQAGTGQATQITTPQIIQLAQGNPAVTELTAKSTSPSVVQLNTAIKPFSDKRAREAVYYATDARAIDTHLFAGMFPVAESFLGPGGLFYQPSVPGYLGYDLAKAKQLVASLGGLTVTLFGPSDPVNQNLLAALQTQWQQAGMKVTIHALTLEGQIQAFQAKTWQAAIGTDGAFDPAVAVGIGFRFFSKAPYSGVHDPALDQMMAAAAATFDQGKRASMYASIARYIASQAYAPFLVAVAPVGVATRSAHGPGIDSPIPVSVVIGPYWDQVWIGKG